MQTIKWCFEDLMNCVKLFNGNKQVINEQIDILIYALEELKVK